MVKMIQSQEFLSFQVLNFVIAVAVARSDFLSATPRSFSFDGGFGRILIFFHRSPHDRRLQPDTSLFLWGEEERRAKCYLRK